MTKSAIEIINEQVLGGNLVSMPMRAWRDIVKQNKDLLNALDEAMNALEFYADDGSWNWHYRDKDRSIVSSDIDDDFGEMARKTLERIKKLREGK